MDRGNRIGCGGGNVSTNIKHIAQSTCIRHTFTLWSTFIAEVLALSNNCSYTLPSYDPKAEFNTVSLMSKASTNAIVSGRNCTCLVKPKKKKTEEEKKKEKKPSKEKKKFSRIRNLNEFSLSMIEMEQTERRWRLARRKTRTIFTTHHQCIHRVFKRVYFHRIQQTTPTRSTSHQPLSKDRNTRTMKQKNIYSMH